MKTPEIDKVLVAAVVVAVVVVMVMMNGGFDLKTLAHPNQHAPPTFTSAATSISRLSYPRWLDDERILNVPDMTQMQRFQSFAGCLNRAETASFGRNRQRFGQRFGQRSPDRTACPTRKR